MGSPPSLTIVATYFIEDFNEEALSEAAYTLHWWLQYVDIYNMATKAEKLTALLDYLNNRHREREMATCLSWKSTATEKR